MRILILICLLGLIGCSSSSKKNAVEDMQTSTHKVDAATEVTKKKEVAQPLPPPVTNETQGTQSTLDRLHDQLNTAIEKQDDRAIAIAARELLIRQPNDTKALNALALYHYKHSEIETAKSLLNKAIALDANMSMLYSNLGMILQAQKDTLGAIQAYRDALRIDSDNAIASANLGSIYAEQKNYSKAQVALETAVKNGQRDWRTLNNYGTALMAVGKAAQAEEPLKKAAELQPQNVDVLMNYAELLVDHLSKPSEGLDVINKIRYIGPGPELRKRISDLENRAKSVLK